MRKYPSEMWVWTFNTLCNQASTVSQVNTSGPKGVGVTSDSIHIYCKVVSLVEVMGWMR